MLHAARCKYRTQKVAENRHLGTIAQVYRAISSQLRHVSTIGKKLLSNDINSTRPRNTVNFGPLAAETGPVVWGTPANFNGFRVLALLLQRRRSREASETCLLGCYTTYTFSGALAPLRNFTRCKMHVTSKSCVVRSPILAALLHGI